MIFLIPSSPIHFKSVSYTLHPLYVNYVGIPAASTTMKSKGRARYTYNAEASVIYKFLAISSEILRRIGALVDTRGSSGLIEIAGDVEFNFSAICSTRCGAPTDLDRPLFYVACATHIISCVHEIVSAHAPLSVLCTRKLPPSARRASSVSTNRDRFRRVVDVFLRLCLWPSSGFIRGKFCFEYQLRINNSSLFYYFVIRVIRIGNFHFLFDIRNYFLVFAD